jgi:hypothetical protein
MNRTGSYRRLIKCVRGIVKRLWQDEIAYTINHDYIITLNCVGGKIEGYIDGEKPYIDGKKQPLFTVEDNSLTAGKIGLYCWANKGACFDEVRIVPPEWASYYTFGEEEPLPPGTRIQVCSGNYKDMPPEKMIADHKTIWRFASTLDDHGRLRFPESRVDLRIHESNQDGIRHTRRFLNNSSYESVKMKVLRKADGTAMFLIVPSGFRRPGQYRLRFIYNLDGSFRASGPRIQKLSEGGSSKPEFVIVDVPWEPYSKLE